MTYRVIVTGCRDWTDRDAISVNLSGLADLLVVHGACYPRLDPRTALRPMKSADWLAEVWARENGVPTEENEADWQKFGNRAGPIRNSAMIAKGADLCIAFWDGKSSGTLDCFSKAARAGIPVRIVPRAAR